MNNYAKQWCNNECKHFDSHCSLLMTSAHEPVLCQTQLGIVSGHTIYYRNVIWCTRPVFFSELSRCDNGRRATIVTPIFYRTGVGAQKLLHGKSDFLSDQKLAHTIWFPFWFFVYGKRSVHVHWALQDILPVFCIIVSSSFLVFSL